MGCLTLSRKQMGVWDERKVGDAMGVRGLGLVCKKNPQVQVKKIESNQGRYWKLAPDLHMHIYTCAHVHIYMHTQHTCKHETHPYVFNHACTTHTN